MTSWRVWLVIFGTVMLPLFVFVSKWCALPFFIVLSWAVIREELSG